MDINVKDKENKIAGTELAVALMQVHLNFLGKKIDHEAETIGISQYLAMITAMTLEKESFESYLDYIKKISLNSAYAYKEILKKENI